VLRNTYEIDRFNGEVIPYQGWVKYDGTPKAVVTAGRTSVSC
jgi:hypothetical protein